VLVQARSRVVARVNKKTTGDVQADVEAAQFDSEKVVRDLKQQVRGGRDWRRAGLGLHAARLVHCSPSVAWRVLAVAEAAAQTRVPAGSRLMRALQSHTLICSAHGALAVRICNGAC